MERTVTIKKACELVGVCRRTIYNWMAAGKIQYVRTAGGAVRILYSSLWRDTDRKPLADVGEVESQQPSM